MAGAYASHGETYVHTPGGDLLGDSPPRLGFLQQVLTAAPYTEMEPVPDSVKSADPSITALAKPGTYYLIHFSQPKERADWNLGVFGPGTPSRPLPVDPVKRAAFVPPAGPTVKVDMGAGVFEVSLIDTWNMKIHSLGYTQGSVQTFSSKMAPAVIRLVRVGRSPPDAPSGSIAELLSRFETDPN